MFELTVQRRFPASHAIVMGGEAETPHEHDWGVVVAVGGPDLDADELLCDFHQLEKRLDGVLDPFRGCDFNATPPFDRINPTAEAIARHIAREMEKGLPAGVTLRRVTVTEAPGCEATYVP